MVKTLVRKIVKKHPELKRKLKMASSHLSSFQYVYQNLMMTFISTIALGVLVFVFFSSNLLYLLIAEVVVLMFSYFIFLFWFHYVDVMISKQRRALDADIMFVSEYLLVSLESGMPIGNAIEELSKIDRPGGKFFRMVFLEFKTGQDLEQTLHEAVSYSPSLMMKTLLKRIKDSLSIGNDLNGILENFISESSEKRLIEIKGFEKKLNPLVMMYLLLGIVLPSLGVTFFILGAAVLEITPALLKYVLILLYMVMFVFQYLAYSSFRFTRATI